MIGILRIPKPAILVPIAALLVASQSPTTESGEGVLCLGTFVYFVEKTGQQCRIGENPEFQARISAYVRRFDAYITRNAEGGSETLERLKESQNLNVTDPEYICEGDVASAYDHFKAQDAEELDRAIDELLAHDGPPRWGDCV